MDLLRKKWVKNLSRFYALNLGRKMVFAIQKANFVDIKSSRFRWYSFVFERMQSRLVSLLVNFSCDLGQIMTRYDFLWARRVILSDSNRLELDLISLLGNFSCDLGQIMTRYDFLWTRRVILSNVRTDSNLINLLSLLVNFSCEFGQIMTI